MLPLHIQLPWQEESQEEASHVQGAQEDPLGLSLRFPLWGQELTVRVAPGRGQPPQEAADQVPGPEVFQRPLQQPRASQAEEGKG